MAKKKSAVFSVLCAVAVIALSEPVAAQSVERVEKRVGKLESEMRAVQRKVFPGANKNYFEPEIAAPSTAAAAPGTPASNPVSDLTARVDSLEQQLVTLTGQLEENGHKLRTLEAAFEKFRTDAQFRITQLEGGTPVPPAGQMPGDGGPSAGATTGATALDPIEGEYRAAYGTVVAKDWSKAEADLQNFVVKHPKHARASHAQYWLGRTYFAQNQPVQAARALLENYQSRPEGERAADSLLWLGKSLMAFSPPSPAKACEAYDQLKAGYAKTMSAEIKTQLAEARAAAKCK